MKKIDNRWSDPILLQGEINTISMDYYPTLSSNGNLYFSRAGDIYFSEYKDNK